MRHHLNSIADLVGMFDRKLFVYRRFRSNAAVVPVVPYKLVQVAVVALEAAKN